MEITENLRNKLNDSELYFEKRFDEMRAKFDLFFVITKSNVFSVGVDFLEYRWGWSFDDICGFLREQRRRKQLEFRFNEEEDRVYINLLSFDI